MRLYLKTQTKPHLDKIEGDWSNFQALYLLSCTGRNCKSRADPWECSMWGWEWSQEAKDHQFYVGKGVFGRQVLRENEEVRRSTRSRLPATRKCISCQLCDTHSRTHEELGTRLSFLTGSLPGTQNAWVCHPGFHTPENWVICWFSQRDCDKKYIDIKLLNLWPLVLHANTT